MKDLESINWIASDQLENIYEICANLIVMTF